MRVRLPHHNLALLLSIYLALLTPSSANAGGSSSRDWKHSAITNLSLASRALRCDGPRRIVSHGLGTLAAHGLNPNHYLTHPSTDPDCVAARQGLAQALTDLQFGRDTPASRDPQRRAQADVSAGLLWGYAMLAPTQAQARLPQLIEQAAPRQASYQRVQHAYRDYLQLARKGGFPFIPDGAALKPGQPDSRIEVLRRYLILTGDFPMERWSPRTRPVYDAPLQEALKAFQARHGLTPDGALGKETRHAMNVPVRARLQQLALTLERLRRDAPAGPRYVHINLPGFRLEAYDAGKPVLAMKVIVGEKKNPTPEFRNQITQVVLNPTWTPTHRILRDEMLPKARRNPASLQGYQVTDRRTGQRLDPFQVDWTQLSANDVHVEQPAGQDNALGKVKFLMPKSDSIYLHDTARPQLFSQTYRALSHGCIRLEKPKDFAAFVFRVSRPDEASQIAARYEDSASRSYTMTTPLPVITTYYTAWVNQEGQPEFYPDMYGRDATLLAALTRHQPTGGDAQLAALR